MAMKEEEGTLEESNWLPWLSERFPSPKTVQSVFDILGQPSPAHAVCTGRSCDEMSSGLREGTSDVFGFTVYFVPFLISPLGLFIIFIFFPVNFACEGVVGGRTCGCWGYKWLRWWWVVWQERGSYMSRGATRWLAWKRG